MSSLTIILTKISYYHYDCYMEEIKSLDSPIRGHSIEKCLSHREPETRKRLEFVTCALCTRGLIPLLPKADMVFSPTMKPPKFKEVPSGWLIFSIAFARVCWGSAWADWNDEQPAKKRVNVSGKEITLIMPPIPKAFAALCESFCITKLRVVIDWAVENDLSENQMEDLGGDLAFECMGSGVQWTDDYPKMPHPFSHGQPGYANKPRIELICFKQGRKFLVDTSGM